MQLSPRILAVALATLFFAASPTHTIAQTLAPPAARPPSPTSKRITIDVVIDAKNTKNPANVTGLQQQDFAVFDNKIPRPLSSFREISAHQQPGRVVVLIDAANIGTQWLGHAREQASQFLRAHGGHLAYPTAIAILTDKGVEMQNDFSTDGNAMSQALEQQDIGIRTITRDTGVYGAEDRFGISMSGLRNLVARVAQQPGRTVILWISPGWPILSGPGIDLSNKQLLGIFGDVVDLSTQLREGRTTLYAIDPIGANESLDRTDYYQAFLKGISKPSQAQIGDLSLQVLAEQSGGLALNANDTATLMEKCVADLDDYYEISFEPAATETPSTYHHLDVRLDKPELTARTRDGYYAQP